MKTTHNYLSFEDLPRIEEKLKTYDLRAYTVQDIMFLFHCCYFLGFRISEALALQWKDIDLDEKKLLLRKTKTKKFVELYIPPQLLEKFLPFYQYHTIEYPEEANVFPTIRYRTLVFLLKKLGNDLKLNCWTESQKDTGEKTISHIFRKSIGKDMLLGRFGKKAELPLVQQKLRHESLTTTSKYLKSNIQNEEEFWK